MRQFLLIFLCALSSTAQESAWKQTRAIAAAEAHQAAVADEQFVYAISDAKVGKYDRETGKLVATSTGSAHHLNSGFLFEGKIYLAHSNYPKMPEASQIYVLDPGSMKLEVFKDFGNFGGSLTWAIRRNGHWWCNFALYDKDNGKTFLVEFDQNWKELRRFSLPPELITQLGKYSLSGGVWRGEELYVTGHTDPVLFRLRLPREGKMLEFVAKEKCPFTGQGIANDVNADAMLGINRNKKLIVFAERL